MGDALPVPYVVQGTAKDCLATVYQKHRSLQTPKEEV